MGTGQSVGVEERGITVRDSGKTNDNLSREDLLVKSSTED